MAEYIELEPLREEIFNDDFNCDIINHFLNIVDSQPTADVVEVKHSKWVGISDYGDGNCIAYCYKCGTTTKAKNPTALKMFHKYCHWCGAKMDKKEGAEE